MGGISNETIALASVLVFVAILTVSWVFRKWFIIIPPRKLAIKETLGKFSNILYPGFHIVAWPLSCLRTIRWTYFGQNGKARIVGGTMIPYQNNQMDIPPIQAFTKNYIETSLDGTVMYHISDPQKAVYRTDDVLNIFYQCIKQETKALIMNHTSAELLQKPPKLLGQSIVDAVTEIFDPEVNGITISNFTVQDISVNDQLRLENQKIASAARQQEILIEQEKSKAQLENLQLQIRHDREVEKARITYEAELKEIEFQRKLQQEKDDAERARQTARIEREQQELQAKLDAELKTSETRAKQRALELESDGFTPEQRLELERIRGLNAVAANEKVTTVYAPSSEWIPRNMIGLIGKE